MFDWEQVQELQELTQPYFKKRENEKLNQKDKEFKTKQLAVILEKEKKCNSKAARDHLDAKIKYLSDQEVRKETENINKLVLETIDNGTYNPIPLIKDSFQNNQRFDDNFYGRLENSFESLKTETSFYNATHEEKLLELNQIAYISDYLKRELYIEKYEGKFEVIRFGYSKYNSKLNNPFEYYYKQKIRIPFLINPDNCNKAYHNSK